MNQEKIGRFIAYLRKEKNMTQQDLADKLGVTKNAVSKWERGISLMDISLLKPISELFEITISEILSGERLEIVNDVNVNDSFIEGTKFYLKKSKKEIYMKIVLILFVFLLFMLCVLNFISEFNYGEIPILNINCHNVSSIIAKKKADKYIELLLNKDIAVLNDYVVSNNYYLINDNTESKEWNEIEKKMHSQSYADNLKSFYDNVKITNCKYQSFYYDGNNYAYTYYLTIVYNNKKYLIDVSIRPHIDKVELSFGWFQDLNNGIYGLDEYSELYNILYSVFSW